METYIKYKRISEAIEEKNFQNFFDQLIKDGWEIIYYSEKEPVIERQKIDVASEIEYRKIPITIIVGKKQNNIL